VISTVLIIISDDGYAPSVLTYFDTAICISRTDDVVHSSQPPSLNNFTTHTGFPCFNLPRYCTCECVIKAVIPFGLFSCVAHHLGTTQKATFIHWSMKPVVAAMIPLSSLHSVPRVPLFQKPASRIFFQIVDVVWRPPSYFWLLPSLLPAVLPRRASGVVSAADCYR
jgi:hypothetical protein